MSEPKNTDVRCPRCDVMFVTALEADASIVNCPKCERTIWLLPQSIQRGPYCSGFCRTCGTGCAEYCEDIHELRAKLKIATGALERIKDYAGTVGEKPRRLHDGFVFGAAIMALGRMRE